MSFSSAKQKHNPLRFALSACVLFFLDAAFEARALTLMLPESNSNIVGEIQEIKAHAGDSLDKIARRKDIGIIELIAANPQLKDQRLKTGDAILIPTAFILPNTPREGIVINLPELRLYYYPPGQNYVLTYPIGIGREGWETPTSKTFVENKEELPYWYPPESIRDFTLKTKGYLLPKVVAPGPENPLGEFVIRLNLAGYLIHGTNNPASVGKRSSAGCIRMYPEDIAELFSLVQPGTTVYIIHDPFKLGWFRNEIYIETHQPLDAYNGHYLLNEKIYQATHGIHTSIDWPQTEKISNQFMGYPVFIGEVKNNENK